MRLNVLAKIFNLSIEAKHSPILFHITSSENADSIVKDGYFVLKPGEASNVEIKYSGHNYYLSTARVFSNSYFKGMSLADAVFVLDGTKLGARYKIKPINYWEGSHKRLESEDRILSKKPHLPLWPYIKELRLISPSGQLGISLTKQAYRLLKKRGIKVSLYTKMTDAALGKNEVIINPAKLKSAKSKSQSASGISPSVLAEVKALDLLAKYSTDKLAKLIKNSQGTKIRDVLYDWGRISNNLANTEHHYNLNTSIKLLSASAKTIPLIQGIIGEIRRNKLRNAAQLLDMHLPKLKQAWKLVWDSDKDEAQAS